MENHIYLYNEIGGWGNTAEEVKDLIKNNPKSDVIVVHISSPGGEVFEGWTIGNILKNSGKKVVAKIEGLCASIATYIALQADEVQMADTARFMIHNPWMGMEGEQKDFEAASAQLATIKQDLIKTYKSKTGLEESLLSDMMDKETWLNSDESVEFGFVDSVMSGVKAVAKINYNKYMADNKVVENQPEKKPSKLDMIHDGLMKALNELSEQLDANNEVEVKDEVIQPTNIDVELADGGMLFVESEDGEFVGKRAYLTDEEGNRSEQPAPEGTHQLKDGRSIVVDGEGVIIEITEASTDEVAEDKDKIIEDLKAELDAKNQEMKTLNNKFDEQDDKMKDLSEKVSELTNLAKMTVGGEPKVAVANIKPKSINQEPAKTHKLDAFAKNLKQNRK